MFDPSFAFWYSLGGGVVMPFVEPILWLPAFIIGRNSPATRRFWLELPIGITIAFFIGWRENGFESMANLGVTVELVQFFRPAFAAFLPAVIACLVWKGATAIVSVVRARQV